VRQYEIQQKDLRRQIELQVRRASANCKLAASQAEDSELAVKLSEEELTQARRRFEGGVTATPKWWKRKPKLRNRRDDRIGVLFAWSQRKWDLAQATGNGVAVVEVTTIQLSGRALVHCPVTDRSR